MEASASVSIQKQIQPNPFSFPKTKTKPLQVTFKLRAASSSSTEKYDWDTSPSPPLVTPRRRSKNISRPIRSHRSLIKIATSWDWRWNGKLTSDYIFSLDELRLGDLAEDGHKDAEVFITLTIEKHASFGFSVDGRITTSFGRKCINCSSSYCKEVIYVKPGCEANLDSLIQDTIRLTTSVKETCSESCEKAEQRWQFGTNETSSSIDGRWSTLLKLKGKTI
ncbi:hypothetical protein IFM89_036430 [Coptis chinensis]|uniref:Uncharacterized protein n=1 Tax=Coptis chinensis TaxID=261450 RepID=A0A835M8A9_9MAGN|nr:hypothetical protein IFM89_036430 [Coptis chinensis]